jgi:hypothetical protein
MSVLDQVLGALLQVQSTQGTIIERLDHTIQRVDDVHSICSNCGARKVSESKAELAQAQSLAGSARAGRFFYLVLLLSVVQTAVTVVALLC